jgi:C1A family cysteine protease
MNRKYGYIRDVRNKHGLEKIYRPKLRQTQFPMKFDLADLSPAPNPAFGLLDQGELGSCTGFGCKRAAWFGLNAVAQAAVPPSQAVEPSALFIYYNERVIEGDVEQDNGAQICDGIAALKKYGVCPEADCPYDPTQFAVQPSDQAYNDALKFEALQAERIDNPGDSVALAVNIMDALFNQQLPIVFGADVFPQFESAAAAQTGLIDMPQAGATPIGGHCMLIRGWDNFAPGGPRAKISNSWGQWGDNGCAWILFDYLAMYASDLWCISQME